MNAGKKAVCSEYITSKFFEIPVLLGAYHIEPRKEYEMPIDGLTDVTRPVRQGCIRLGIKKIKKTAKGDIEYPAEVDYFILSPETPDQKEKQRLIDLFHSKFGDKPKVIPITLPYSELEKVFPQNYKRYGRNTSLKCIGNGLQAECMEKEFSKGLEITGESKKGLTIVKCEGRECIYSTTNENTPTKECRATATLNVKIHALGGMGNWQITTGSINSILNINSCIRDLIDEYGRAHMLPLVLERRPQEINYKGRKTVHYILHINTHKSIEAMVEQALMAPERVLIEAYGKQMEELPAPEEIMDADVLKAPVDSEEEPEPDLTNTEKQLVSSAVTEAKKQDEEQESFIDGVKKDAEEELGVNTKEPPKTAIQSPQNKASEYPSNFWEFATYAKKELKAAGKEDLYEDCLHVYSIKVLSDLKDDLKKQADFRSYLEGVLEENL